MQLENETNPNEATYETTNEDINKDINKDIEDINEITNKCKDEDVRAADRKPNNIKMQSDVIEQFNTNQQSNMTLSAYSSITQTYNSVKIGSFTGEDS